jgi:uncharacterized membrane protein
MKFSNIYLGMFIAGVGLGAILAGLEQYALMSIPILVGVVFLAVFFFARIFETLGEIEAKSKRSYEEMEQIFKEKFAKKSKKRVQK